MSAPALDRRISVAPMMDRTDRHLRYLLRLIAKRVLLYTEMIPTGAILRGKRERFLEFDAAEHPVALQFGGSDPGALAECAAIAEDWGYDEVNLNVGCPSDRVSAGRFGACLMAEPDLVARCVGAMRRATALPVTVKTRIGIDDSDDYPHFERFVATVAAAGAEAFVVHARKAWLCGLSPRANREIPPLRYELVHRLKRRHPGLTVVINGGLRTVEAAAAQLGQVDGVMVGRAACEDPYLLAGLERAVYGASDAPLREALVEAYAGYVERRLAEGVPLWRMTRHILGLYQGVPGARAWRRTLGEGAHRPGEGAGLIRSAAAHVRQRPPIAA